MKKLNIFSNKASSLTKNIVAASAVAGLTLGVTSTTSYFALTTTINKLMGTAKDGLQAIYAGLLGIVTVLAVVICAWCFVTKMFSKNPRSIDEANQWMKRTIIAWLCFMLISVFVKIGLDIVTGAGANTEAPWE